MVSLRSFSRPFLSSGLVYRDGHDRIGQCALAGRGKVIIFLSLGVCLAAVAVAVGSGWIILNWREGIKVFLGVIFFGAITAGLDSEYQLPGARDSPQ